MASKAERVVIRALESYIRHAGEGMLAIVKATGQPRIKIAVSALYRFHDPDSGYARLEDAIRELGGVLDSIDGRLVRYRGRLYIEVPVSYVEDVIRRKHG